MLSSPGGGLDQWGDLMGLKVFLGNAPWYKRGFYGVRAGSRWPHFEAEGNRYMPFPFQLAYAAALLEKLGLEILLVDGIAEGISEDEFLARIGDFDPDLILLEVSLSSFGTDLGIARRIRELMGQSVQLAFCGPHAQMFKPEFLNAHTEVDLVLIGEYEQTLANTAQVMAAGRDPAQVPGLILRNRLGKALSTGPPELIKNIDSLPWPARHFLPMNNYFDNPGSLPEPSLQIWASRGCPFSCTYCIWPQVMNGNRYRPRNIRDVLDEMEQVCDEYGFRSVYFDDDTFNIGKERMLAFCSEKKRRSLDIPWAIMARADLMDQEILRAMAETGLKAIKYGIESADERLLKHVKKDLNLKKAKKNIEITKSLGIKVHLTFMLGIPGETKQTIKKTVDLAKELDPDSLQFSILTPLPGTQIYEELLEKGHLIEKDWGKYDGYNSSVIRTDELTCSDLERALRYAWRSWFIHKSIHKLTWKEIRQLVRSIPRYICHPVRGLSQAKRLFIN